MNIINLIVISSLFITQSAIAKKVKRKHIPKMKIGVYIPLSGGLRNFGIAYKKGLELSYSSLSKKDKQLSNSISYVFIDTNIKESFKPSSLINDQGEKLNLIIGGLTTFEQKKLVELSQQNNIIYMSPFIAIPKNDKKILMDISTITPSPESVLENIVNEMTKKNQVILYSENKKPAERTCNKNNCINIIEFFSKNEHLKKEVKKNNLLITFINKEDKDILYSKLNDLKFKGEVLTSTFIKQKNNTNYPFSINYHVAYSKLHPKGSVFSSLFTKKYLTKANSLHVLGYECGNYIAELTNLSSTHQARAILNATETIQQFEGVHGSIKKDANNKWRRKFAKLKSTNNGSRYLKEY